MLTRDDALNRLEIALQHSKADQIEVVLITHDHGLTRLAGGGIHQNVATTDVSARVRAVVGKRVGVAVANTLDAEGLKALVDRATAIAKVTSPNPDFVSLPAPEAEPYVFSSGTLASPAPVVDRAFSTEARGDAAVTMVETARGNGTEANGSVSTAVNTLAVGNSLGVRAHHTWTESTVSAIITRGDASGYAQWSGTSLDGAPVGETTSAAVSKCLAAAQPTTVEPGRYTVILEPPAVAEMLAMLAYMGLGATAYQEGRSFLSGKLGQQLVGENITLYDNGRHPQTIHYPFDYEGVPKHVVHFFRHGVAEGVAYDAYTAGKEPGQAHSTGHALPAPNTFGPMPWNLVLEHGGDSRARLLEGVERGILVTRFHYVNVVHPTEAIITGMTRDGTFLIEHGSVTQAVNKLRFTQSILEAFRHTTALEDTLTLVNMEGLYCLVPTLRIDNFNFTSASPG